MNSFINDIFEHIAGESSRLTVSLLNDSHITANEHNSQSNILYRKILNRLQYVQYENIHKEIKLKKIKEKGMRQLYTALKIHI